ncbi:TPA: LacI family DNA-binding transcriptional regulator [Kluyvera ascorbata]|nr:LacI family DNA-binding transcriptional regulator [Kluyvera ascorbata]
MSLKAIAKELGISVTTVSRALNGYDDVSKETRARVEAEARRRGYRPNTFARRLKMGKIGAVGLVFPTQSAPLSNNVFLEMVGEVSRELARDEIDLLLIADDDKSNQHGYMRLVQSGRVDALIVSHTLDNDPRLMLLQEAGFPFLALGRSNLANPYAWFDFDNYAGTYQATRFLIAQGHQRITMFSEDTERAFLLLRRRGYVDAMNESGLPVRLLLCPPPTRRMGYQVMLEQLRGSEPGPTAVITDGNVAGDGAAMALNQQGLLTGDNRVSLVVYDGLSEDSIIDVPVGAIIESTRRSVGRQIASMVRQLIAGEDIASLQVLWQPEFLPPQ